jgi:hypothetical protein
MTERETNALAAAVAERLALKMGGTPPCFCRSPEEAAYHDRHHRLLGTILQPEPDDRPEEVATSIIADHRFVRCLRDAADAGAERAWSRIVDRGIDALWHLIILSATGGAIWSALQ